MAVQETIAASPVEWGHFVVAMSLIVAGWWTFRNLDRKEDADKDRRLEEKYDRLSRESISENKVRQIVADKIEPFQRVQENTLNCVTKIGDDLTDYMRAQGENGVRVRDLERRMDKSEEKGG